ncbi:basic juvenile hormone-suppressible protein 2-like [Aricia agestis]|uniref:basic juvenile hormone-suppressible protein 2-like n=1 Tax=Aricia agestis TaxID=91739 RepID=UPI001C206F42|nr:basic juvenile hormone-suppressible protein 2-like [Aricia agestis]
MKGIACLILALAAAAVARPDGEFTNLVFNDIKHKQEFIFKLLNNVMQPVMYKEIEEIGKDIKFEDKVDFYTKPEVVKTFVKNLKFGFLPRGEIFTLHIDRQMKEVISMFHMLYYAKDFETFIKTACWMRLYLNEGMFVYALTVAVRHRDDCKGIILPPPYEIYPYYFVRGDVIQKAYLLKMKKGLVDHKLCDFYGIKVTDKKVYIIDENVYDTRVHLNEEDRLRYFTEDIDLNTYYYYFHIDYPFWMGEQVNNKVMFRRWELTLYVYQQILARYYMERLSNGLGEITTFSWDTTIMKGYWPWLILHNGVQLPVRMNNFNFIGNYNVGVMKLAKDYENIITEAVVKGYIEINGFRYELNKEEDIEHLGKLIYGAVEKTDLTKYQIHAYRYLLVLMKSVIGLNTVTSDKYFVVPSVLDNYQTALRDPVFYQLQKRLFYFVMIFKNRLPSYTHEDLYFPGVKVENVVVDKLVTYFDDYLMDMTNAVTYNDNELKKATPDMVFFARKRRLNHQPFEVKFEIESDKQVDCVVRLFLGPKEDHTGRLFDINENRFNFVELDSFMYKLVTGKNFIVRKSMDMHNLIGDRMMTYNIWNKFQSTTDVKDFFMKDLRNYMTGFPTRLLLPKGTVGGMNMMLYVIVSPLKLIDNIDAEIFDADRREFVVDFRSSMLLDKMPLGFPFDRMIDVSKFFTPNMKFVDVTIFHKNQVCDMKTRWNRWVLKNYDLIDRTGTVMENNYFVDIFPKRSGGTMKVLCLVLGLSAFAAASGILEDNIVNTNNGVSDIKQRQIIILKLLNNILEPLVDKDIKDVGTNFDIERNINLFTKPEVVKEFIKHLKLGMLPRGEVFTLTIDRQLKEVISAFHVLYFAKDFDTFVKTACWMRLNLNEGMFVYALTVAVRHRNDCKGIILPPPYEIYPYFFVRADVIQKAYLLKMKKGLLDKKLCDLYGIKKTDKEVYIIDENVFDRRVVLNKEDRLRYFTEDIGLNTYYYYFHVDYPFWMKDTIVNNKLLTRRWELTLYINQQILARYHLERLSNNLGEIDQLDLNTIVKKGYWPWMLLHNGVQLPVRLNNHIITHEKNTDVIHLVKVYEDIITGAIIKGFVEINGVRLDLVKAEDVEVLGKLIFGMIEDKNNLSTVTVEAYRYLLILLKDVVGVNTIHNDKYFVVPTVLDNFQTTLRDPVFYQLQKRLCNLLILFKKRLPCYTRDELTFPGLKIDNVVVDKLETFFDDHIMDMTNALILNKDEQMTTKSEMTVLVRKRRLNHKPFKVVIDVLSDKTVDSVVRIFLGPKQDTLGRLIDINKNRLNFVEIDSFLYKLNTGKNTIVRNSIDMHNIVRDRMMTRDLLKKIDTITDVRDLLMKDLKNYMTGFPARLILPKGHIGGMKMMLYVIVTPLKLVDGVDVNLLDTTRQGLTVDYRSTVLLDKMPLGFPLDRQIDLVRFNTPNMKFVDVNIFHKPQVCDMKTRWNRWVLRDYDLVDMTTVINDDFNVEVDVNNKLYKNSNIVDI